MLVRCFYSGLVLLVGRLLSQPPRTLQQGGGLPFVARVALLACAVRLAFVMCASGGFLLDYAFLTIVSLCALQRGAIVGHA